MLPPNVRPHLETMPITPVSQTEENLDGTPVFPFWKRAFFRLVSAASDTFFDPHV